MQQGFTVTNILVYSQFSCIRGNITELHMNLKVFSNDDLTEQLKKGLEESTTLYP